MKSIFKSWFLSREKLALQQNHLEKAVLFDVLSQFCSFLQGCITDFKYCCFTFTKKFLTTLENPGKLFQKLFNPMGFHSMAQMFLASSWA